MSKSRYFTIDGPLDRPQKRSAGLIYQKQREREGDVAPDYRQGNWEGASTLDVKNPAAASQQPNMLTYSPEPMTSPYLVKAGERIAITDNVHLTVSEGYTVRDWGARKNQHSTGVDFITSDGKAYSLTNGVVEVVGLHGSGARITPEEGKEGGYYIVVRNQDGSRSQYMHLDPMTRGEMEGLRGKQLNRGDYIWGYSTGSGSMTNPHIKYRVYVGDKATNSHIDPSEYIRGLK